MAANHPDMVLGFEDDVWWSREAQPQLHAWSDDQPARLVEKTVPAKDPEGKAVACYGLYGPAVNHMMYAQVASERVMREALRERAHGEESSNSPGTKVSSS